MLVRFLSFRPAAARLAIARSAVARSAVARAAVVGVLPALLACDLLPTRDRFASAPVADTLAFTVDTRERHAISPLIYGANFATEKEAWGGALPPAGVTLDRMGGNRLSAYNWETNASNAGRDYRYQNDQLLSSSTTPGEAVRTRAAAAQARGLTFLPTVPMLPYVAGDFCGCDVGIRDAERANRLAVHFKRNVPSRGAAPADARPDANDGVVAQDEFVRWYQAAFPALGVDSTRPLLLTLDNEPDLWHDTHKEVQSDWNDDASRPRLQTYDAFIDTTIAFARAIKRVAPRAQLLGPGLATYAGFMTLGRHPHPDPVYTDWHTQPFLDVYLRRMRAAEQPGGGRLLDVLDLHWYPQLDVGGRMITDDHAEQDERIENARMQAPRSLWDPGFDEKSWVSSTAGGPIRLLPYLRERIARHYPGTRIAITEYFFGRAGDITGGITQADVLGIFGREGVYAAALWPQAGLDAAPYDGDGRKAYAYAFAAFRMFRDYDGRGGRFGDVGVRATTSDPAASSVYASVDAEGRVVLVAINKQRVAAPVRIVLTHAGPLRSAHSFQLTAGSASPAAGPAPVLEGGTTVRYTMPALSVSTLVLAP